MAGRLGRDVRPIKVVVGIMRHPKSHHHAQRGLVRRDGHRDEPRQPVPADDVTVAFRRPRLCSPFTLQALHQ